jgi:hypothetical protein
MKYNLLIVLIILININSQAQQTLSLRIFDSQTKEPIPYALIRTANSNQYYVSNEEGLVFIHSVKQEGLEISHISYYPILIKNMQKADSFIYLIPSTTMLNEIIVKASTLSALDILEEAINNIPKIFHQSTNSYHAFYREENLVFDNNSEKKGYDVIEAQFKVNHQGYALKTKKEKYNAELIKARKVILENNIDTAFNNVASDLEEKGGIFSCLDYDLQDIKKIHPLHKTKEYHYYFSDVLNEQYYIINFSPKDNAKYKGQIFIDKTNNSFKKIEFNWVKPFAKQIMGVYVEIIDKYAIINFEEINGEIHPSFIQKGFHFSIKLKGLDQKVSKTNTFVLESVEDNYMPISKENAYFHNQKLTETTTDKYTVNYWEKLPKLLPSKYKEIAK